MANYWYDEADASYNTSSPSDSRWSESYVVSYEPAEGKYYCECPAYRFGAPKHCKHIDREWYGLYKHVTEAAAKAFKGTEKRSAVLEPPSDPATQYTVSMNGNEPRTLERPLLDWLLDALLAGDEITVRRA